MAGVGVVVVLVSDSWNYAESLAVFSGEFTCQPFGGGCQHGIVVPVCPGELVGAVADVTHYLESEGLRLLSLSPWCFPVRAMRHSARPMKPIPRVPWLITFSMVSSGSRPSEPFQSVDITRGELLGESGFLEIETLFELQGGYVEHFIEFLEEPADALFGIF